MLDKEKPGERGCSTCRDRARAHIDTGDAGIDTRLTISICRITDGRIAEEWATWDALGFLQQIGVIPELVGQAKEKGAG